MIKALSQKEECGSRTVSYFCDCLGISRQGYYKHSTTECELEILRTSIVLYAQYVKDRLLPKAGMRELYEMCKRHFGDKLTIGRDRCYAIFNANGLVQRKKRRPRTTNSNHNFYIYPDLLNTSPKLVAQRFGQLVVADITYVATDKGWAYLALLTDAATRLIVGHALYPTLETEGPLMALRKALIFMKSNGADLSWLIHHSDRGVQYCSNEYVKVLKDAGTHISMTQTGDPLHNALAERMNNTIKNGWLFDCEGRSFNEVSKLIDNAVFMYNNVRPHQSLDNLTPMEKLEQLKKSA